MSENGYLNNIATGRYIGIYNSQDWRCYTSEGGNIADQTFAFYKKVSSGTIAQTIALTAGTNWFSTYLVITLADLESALNAALPNAGSMKIKGKDKYTTYNGRVWRGQLTTLDVALMYMIEVPEACEITLEGMPIDPAEHSITINQGSNWIGFPFSADMTVINAFAGFAVNGDVLKAKDKYTTYTNGRWRGQLSNLEPGKGYIYNSSASEQKTFVYPTAK